MIMNMFNTYPQAMFYAFKVVESDVVVGMAGIKQSELFRTLTDYCDNNCTNLNAFVQSLDGLVDPELRWKYWFDLVRE
jgi:hypothetical protein